MAYQDLRDWLKAVERVGPIKMIRGAHWDLEIGAITTIAHLKAQEELATRLNCPAIMFDEIANYPPGYRVLVNFLESTDRVALTLGMPLKLSPMEFVKAWKEKLHSIKPLPPVKVKDGPVLEKIQEGDKVDLFQFPAPKWHELDGGRYIGTGSVTITRDPDESWVNLGTYRVQVHDEKTLGFWISPGQQGRIHREKYFERGKPCPVAISIGHDPTLTLAGTMKLPWGLSEYDFVGGIRGRPVEVIEGEFTGLPVPAHAEIVIEGESLPGETRTEGPFGEWTRYYGSSSRPEPLIRVKRVMYRRDPIILGDAPGGGGKVFRQLLIPANIWEDLEKAGIPEVKGVWCNEAAGEQLIIIVSIKQRYPGHARQAALAATSCQSGARMGRYIIVVDEDIDPANIQDVLWAVGTRSDPERSIEIIRRCWSTSLDPAIPRELWGMNSRAIIDACRPYEWIGEFPKVVEVSKPLYDRTIEKWGRILFS